MNSSQQSSTSDDTDMVDYQQSQKGEDDDELILMNLSHEIMRTNHLKHSSKANNSIGSKSNNADDLLKSPQK